MNSKFLSNSLFGVVLLVLAPATASFAADPPSVISHQGRMTVGGVNFNGTGFFKFALVDTGAATTYWNNDLSQGAMTEPLDGNAVPVTVVNGHYAVGLGDATLTNMGALDPDIFANNADVNLRIWFSATGAAASFELLTPDIEVNSVGFSLNARKAQMVPDGSITAAQISSTYYNQMNSAALGDPELDSTDLANGNLTLTTTFAVPFDAPPTVDVEAGPGAIVNFSSLTGTGFTADISNVEFVKGLLGNDPVGHMACATVNGNPAFVYHNFPQDEIRYAYSNSPTGAPGTWSDRLIVSGAELGGGQGGLAMAIIAGNPAICWHDVEFTDPTMGEVRYARASEPTGITGNWAFATITSGTFNPGTTNLRYSYSVSLAEINGAPAVLFPVYDGVSNVDLVYAYSTDADGIPSSTWDGNTLTLFTTAVATNPPNSGTNFTGKTVSLKKVNGNPAFSYNVEGLNDVAYHYSSTVQGAALIDWTSVLVDGTVPSITYNSLEIVNGVPAIAYGGGSGVDLSFAYGSDIQGSGAWNLVGVGTTPSGATSQYVSLVVIGGKPAISHFDPFNTTGDVLLYSFSSDVQGITGSWSTMVADSDKETGRWSCLIDAGGLPGIAYRYFFDSPMGPAEDLFGLRFGTLPVPVMWTAAGGDQLPIDVKTASSAESVIDGAITTASIANGSITAAKLAPGALASITLPPNSITTIELATGAVRSSDILDGDVRTEDLDDNAVTNAKLGFDSVTTNEIVNASVFGIDLAADTITAGNLAPSSVGSSEIATNAVGDTELASNAVDAAAIQLGAVGLNKIATAGGSNGQVITLSAGVPTWVTPAAGSDSQTLSLATDTLSISGGNSVSLGQYLRSNTSDSFSSGILTMGTATSLHVDGSFRIGSNSSTDDDSIIFDSIAQPETLQWDNSDTRLEFSDEFAISGPLQAGSTSTAPASYSRFGTSATTHGLSGSNSVLISGILEVNSTIFADSAIIGTSIGLSAGITAQGGIVAGGPINGGNTAGEPYNYFSDVAPAPTTTDITNEGDVYVRNDVEIGGTLYLSDQIRMGTDEGDQSIYFYEAGSQTGERIFWDDSLDRFEITDDLVALTFGPSSDRNMKEGFEEVDPAEVLEKVAGIPITKWNYKIDDRKTVHIGPVAQDFYAAFQVGPDDKHITTTDADGVALAAIQALKALVDEKDAQIKALEKRLEKLEKALLPEVPYREMDSRVKDGQFETRTPR